MKHVDIYLSEKSGNTLIYGIGKNVQLEMYVAEQKVILQTTLVVP